MYIPKVGHTIMIKRPRWARPCHFSIGEWAWKEFEAKPCVVSSVTATSVSVEGYGFCIPLDSVHPALLEDNV